MNRVYSKRAIEKLKLKKSNSSNWTAVIPAAGKGTRLGHHLPKILYPINGVTILERVVQKLRPYCDRFVFILSPSGKEVVEPYLKTLLPASYTIVIQDPPLGMGDAIFSAKGKVLSAYSLILWGDQVAIRDETLDLLTSFHESQITQIFTLPSYLKKKPYIHFQRNDNQDIINVLEQREGDMLPMVGESDCGLFAFNTDQLFEVLENNWENPSVMGKLTKEKNFLPFFPFFSKYGNISTLRIIEEAETVGVNTIEDVDKIIEVLR